MGLGWTWLLTLLAVNLGVCEDLQQVSIPVPALSALRFLYRLHTEGYRLRLTVSMPAGNSNLAGANLACDGVAQLLWSTYAVEMTMTGYVQCVSDVDRAARRLRDPPWTRVPSIWLHATALMSEYYSTVHLVEAAMLGAGLGSLDSNVAQSPSKVAFLLPLVAALPPPPSGTSTHVCDVGFTTGHESLIALVAHPTASVTAFHLGGASQDYSVAVGGLLLKMYPERFSLVSGPITETVFEVLSKTERTCNFLILHSMPRVQLFQALLAARALVSTSQYHTVVVDSPAGSTDEEDVWALLLRRKQVVLQGKLFSAVFGDQAGRESSMVYGYYQ